jgi:replication-associated recombination protein RarA
MFVRPIASECNRNIFVTGDQALARGESIALAPKSNAVYTAWGAVSEDIENTRAEPVPLHLRNVPTKLMRDLKYGSQLSVPILSES